MSSTKTTREEWLLEGAAALSVLVTEKTGRAVPAYCVSVGFPKGARGRRRAIGQCWPSVVAKDGKSHLFVSPELEDAARVLDVLLHELLHAAVGCEAGHKAPFAHAAKACGLVGPWTATTAGEDLTPRLNAIAVQLGAYPHGALVVADRVRPGSRLRLYVCDCGTKVRVASDHFDATCNECETPFERKG
jgi:hypothetical protein